MAELTTELAPHPLLTALREIERRAGRPPERVRWAPRVLDLDLLLYGDRCIEDSALTLPHRGLGSRRFVLEPLAELAPDVVEPHSQRTIRELLTALEDPLRVEKLPATLAGSGSVTAPGASGRS